MRWRSTLETCAAPTLGDMAVTDITVENIKRVLQPIWTTKTETAARLRGWIEAVTAWATVQGHRTVDNPARWEGTLDALLPKPKVGFAVEHHPALNIEGAATWFLELKKRKGFASRALEFGALTAARCGEVRETTWDGFDLTAGVWTIPAGRMKPVREHRVPLSDAAKTPPEGIDRMGNSPFIFLAARGGALLDIALSACVKRINQVRDGGYLNARSKCAAVPHGLCSTFRNCAAEETEYQAARPD